LSGKNKNKQRTTLSSCPFNYVNTAVNPAVTAVKVFFKPLDGDQMVDNVTPVKEKLKYKPSIFLSKGGLRR